MQCPKSITFWREKCYLFREVSKHDHAKKGKVLLVLGKRQCHVKTLPYCEGENVICFGGKSVICLGKRQYSVQTLSC